MRTSTLALATAALLVPAARGFSQSAPAAPLAGTYVLQRMHDSYASRWYKTLTFTQKTTRRRPDGTDAVSTWLESLRYTPETGTQLRIDVGELEDGNGMIYTADSSWRVQAGKAGTPRPQGNEFLPLIEGVYVQPVSRTADELTRFGFNLDHAYRSTFDGQPVWIVGAATASDTLSPQFVVDTVRKVLLRMVLGSAAGQPPTDVRLGGYVKAGNGWLATTVVMSSNGVPVQKEEYSEWKVDVALSPSLFDVTQWSTAPHWGRKTP